MVGLRGELMAAVERSPHMAANHDRAGWISLFAAGGSVEDPVGSRPHVGLAHIGRFYDTFIAPRRIVFRRSYDVVIDTTVVRDVTLEVGMGPTVVMEIPAVLRYDMTNDAAGDWLIDRLRAYWELPAMMMRFLSNGPAAAPHALHLTRALMRHQGLRGTAGFASGFRGARDRGKRTLRAFLEAASAGDELGAWRCLAPGATITHGDRNILKLGPFSEEIRNAVWTKMIAAGSSVTVSLRGRVSGVLIAEVAEGVDAITRLSYFAE